MLQSIIPFVNFFLNLSHITHIVMMSLCVFLLGMLHFPTTVHALMTVVILYNLNQRIGFQTDIEGIWRLMRSAVMDFREHVSMYFGFL